MITDKNFISSQIKNISINDVEREMNELIKFRNNKINNLYEKKS